MARRLLLHKILEDILGSKYVYFQPPENIKIEYPCIIYQRDNSSVKYADDLKYKRVQRYQVTVIDRDPDSETPSRVRSLDYCSEARSFAVAGLNHDVFTLYF